MSSNANFCKMILNDCSMSTQGIYLSNSNENSLYANDLENNTYGIHLFNANENFLYANNLENNIYGIHLFNANDNVIELNRCNNNDGNGITIVGYKSTYCVNNTLTENECFNNGGNGILFFITKNNKVVHNRVSSNTFGISFTHGSDSILLHNNTIEKNSKFGIDASDNEEIVIDATYNWWGHISGPTHAEKNPHGTGDAISDYVEFDPWLGQEEFRTKCVDDDAPDGGDGSRKHPFNRIQDGIDHALEGHTVRVFAGTYYEHVIVDKPVSIIGNGSDDTIIDGNGEGTVVTIRSDWVNLSYLQVTNSSKSWMKAGIHVTQSMHCQIVETNCTGNRDGILLYYSSHINISRNSVFDNGYGIHLVRCSYCNMSSNIISDGSDGIYESYGSNNTIYKNCITRNSRGINLLFATIDSHIYHNSIFENTFYGIYAENNEEITINAWYNWWGNASGPYHPENNTNGTGDKVTDYVSFDPWLIEPIEFSPRANAGGDKATLVDEEIMFHGTGSDIAGTIVMYEWDFDGDGIYDWSSTITGDTTYAYEEDGVYHAVLRVTDTDGLNATDVCIVTIESKGNSIPSISLLGPADRVDVNTISPILTWNGNDIDGDHLSYDIYLDTNPTPSTKIATGQADNHYALSGLEDGKTYYWQVVIHDGESETASEIWSFTVSLPSATPIVNDGDSIAVHYIGYLMDGTLFDASFSHLQGSTLPKSGNFRTSDPSLPLSFTANGGEMIQGFDEGVLGLELGELATITIPPTKAYQDPGLELYNKTLMFDILVVEIEGESATWEDVDSDGDGFPDDMDWALSNGDEWWDHDGDGVGDNADADDDNDGFVDTGEIQFGSNPFDADNIPHIPYITPTVVILSPASNEEVSGVVTIRGAAFNGSGNNRSIEKVEISINGGDWTVVAGTDSWTYEWDTTDVVKGEHEIRVQAYDGEEYSKIVTWNLRIVDPEAPAEDDGEAGDDAGFLPGFEVVGVVLGIFCGVLWRRKNEPLRATSQN